MNREDYNLRNQQAKEIIRHLRHAICTILYQRGVYLEQEFSPVRLYGCCLMIPLNPDLALYIDNLMVQLHQWIVYDKVTELHLTISSSQQEPLEKYCFEFGDNPTYTTEQDSNISIRQSLHFICTSVSWLAPLGTNLGFKIQVVESSAKEPPPLEWAESTPTLIKDPVVRHIPSVHIKTKVISATIHVPKPMAMQPHYESTQIDTPWED